MPNAQKLNKNKYTKYTEKVKIAHRKNNKKV